MSIEIIDWGLTDYQEAWDRQKALVEELKKSRRPGYLVFCEHPTVITLGKNGSSDNIKLAENELESKDVKVIPNNRGGDVTLHNPGQIVGYPIINLSAYKEDLHWFLRTIEYSLIDSLKELGIDSGLYEGFTGVWIQKERKIAAIGLNCSRWITSHGFALNAINDISEFDYIVPCGIEDKKVTSIEAEWNNLGKNGTSLDTQSVKSLIAEKFITRMEKEKK